MSCPRCGASRAESSRFCASCSFDFWADAALSSCPRCHAARSGAMPICPSCGFDYRTVDRASAALPVAQASRLPFVLLTLGFLLILGVAGGLFLSQVTKAQQTTDRQIASYAVHVPPTMAPTTDPEVATAYATFVSHIAAESGKLGDLIGTLSTDASAGEVAAVEKDATALQAWATAEGTWLDANPAQFCYAALYTLWDILRVDAGTTAADALGGKYEEAAADLDQMTADSNGVTRALVAANC